MARSEKPGVAPPPTELGRTAPPDENASGEPEEIWEPAPPSGPPAPAIEARPAPAEGKQFSCANCGAGMKFSPGAVSLTCEYCGHRLEIPQSEQDVQELSFQKYFEAGNVAEEVLHGVEGETRCSGCGAMVEVRTSVSHDNCPFCGTHLTNAIESARPMMRPGALLPFKIERTDARGCFARWVKSRWFAPGDFKKLDRLDRINGIYVPYWTYDSMTFTFYTGMRGDAYYVTVGHGKNQRRERRIRWRPVSGHVNHFFDDVLICGSRSLPEKYVRALEPWDLKAAAPYDGAYLSGFQTERYQVSAVEGFQQARRIMDDEIGRMVRRDIGGDEQRITSIHTQCEGITFKLLLLPVWLAVYRYKDKPFRVMVNARSGEVRGERPWSAGKIAAAVLAALVVLIPVVHLIIQEATR